MLIILMRDKRRLPPLIPARGDPPRPQPLVSYFHFLLGPANRLPPIPQQSRPTKGGVYILSKLRGLT